MNQIMNPIPSSYAYPHNIKKVDQCFCSGIRKLKQNNACLRLFFLLRSIIIFGYLIAHYTSYQSSTTQAETVFSMTSIFYILILAFNGLCLINSTIVFHKYFNKIEVINQIADRIQHSRQIDQNQNLGVGATFVEDQKIKGLLVCTQTYQFSTNLTNEDIDEVYKKRAERNCMTMITLQIDRQNSIRYFYQFLNLLSIALFVYGIVLLTKDPIPSVEFQFILTYMLTEILTRFFIYLILLVIGISPLICLGLCIYSCFCHKQDKVVLPNKVSATQEIIRQCEGQCPICYQSINQNEQVIILRCSTKHVFHQLCIKGWTKIGNTCPICRQHIGSE